MDRKMRRLHGLSLSNFRYNVVLPLDFGFITLRFRPPPSWLIFVHEVADETIDTQSTLLYTVLKATKFRRSDLRFVTWRQLVPCWRSRRPKSWSEADLSFDPAPLQNGIGQQSSVADVVLLCKVVTTWDVMCKCNVTPLEDFSSLLHESPNDGTCCTVSAGVCEIKEIDTMPIYPSLCLIRRE
jgi:hypothetical protein